MTETQTQTHPPVNIDQLQPDPTDAQKAVTDSLVDQFKNGGYRVKPSSEAVPMSEEVRDHEIEELNMALEGVGAAVSRAVKTAIDEVAPNPLESRLNRVAGRETARPTQNSIEKPGSKPAARTEKPLRRSQLNRQR